MKLWNKNTTQTAASIETFTVGDDAVLDLQLAPYDILASFAHALMLEKINLLSKQELELLRHEFALLYQQTKENKFVIDNKMEDVHSQIEFILTKQLGDLGKKIHTGRSRNDQVLVALKLFARHKLKEIALSTNNLIAVFLDKSQAHQKDLMPGYTHFQAAMPSSFGLWFGAYAESLTDDLHTLLAAYKICNQNPLGSGAGFGSSFPLDRSYTTALLGFSSLNYNVVYAQMTRGKFEKIIVQALANIGASLNKFSSDACMYANENHRFISLPSSLTTGSSIMPHKKNPDAFELIRAYTNSLSASANELSMLTHNLPSGYHRDLQLTKGCLLKAFAQLESCLTISTLLVQEMIVHKDILKEDKYKYLFTVEAVNDLVMKGMPFRDAYIQIGNEVEQGTFTFHGQLNHSHEGSIGHLCNTQIAEKAKQIDDDFEFAKVEHQEEKLLSLLFNK